MDTERVLSGQTVLVEGGRITALGPASQICIPAGAARIDSQGKFLHAKTYGEKEAVIDSRAG